MRFEMEIRVTVCILPVKSNEDVKNNAKKCKNMVDKLEKYMIL